MSSYYWLVFQTALRQTWNFADAQGIFIGILIMFLSAACDIGFRWRQRRWSALRPVRARLKAALLPLVILIIAVVFYQLLSVPSVMWVNDKNTIKDLNVTVEKQKKQVSKLQAETLESKQRIKHFADRVPMPQPTSEQQLEIKVALEKIGRHTVNIKYLVHDTSRPWFFASELAKVFRSALWHVKMAGVSEEGLSPINFSKKGLGILVETEESMTAVQKAVLRTITPISATYGISVVQGHNVADRIELEVGDM